jgi:hypothetical protein
MRLGPRRDSSGIFATVLAAVRGETRKVLLVTELGDALMGAAGLHLLLGKSRLEAFALSEDIAAALAYAAADAGAIGLVSIQSRITELIRVINRMREPGHDLSHADAEFLKRGISSTLGIVRRVIDDIDRVGAGVTEKRPAPLARRLLLAAARMLPAEDRDRYAEEFRSELADIALAGGGRRVQLAYAARQLRSAPRLRADLRSPQRRSAAP